MRHDQDIAPQLSTLQVEADGGSSKTDTFEFFLYHTSKSLNEIQYAVHTCTGVTIIKSTPETQCS